MPSESHFQGSGQRYPHSIDQRNTRLEPLAPSSDSGTGILMTVLGEFVLPAGGSAWTQTLVRALELQGIRDKAARQVLARTEARGWLTRERVGRQTRWSLTPALRSVLSAGAERIYGFGRYERAWDGRWLLLFASIPDADRKLRYRMVRSLRWAGFGSLHNGVWLSPWTSTETMIVPELERLQVRARTFHAEIGALGDPSELAAEAWDLNALRSEYDSFIDFVSTNAGGSETATLTQLVHRWRRFPLIDPDLPPSLHAQGWPGSTAATLFAERRNALQPPAGRWWREQEAVHAPAGWSDG